MSVDPVVYGFDVGPVTLLHDPYFQAEIIEDARVTAIPNTEKWFMGMTALRGHLIPVFDIGAFIDDANRSTVTKRKIVVVGANEEAAGIYIDSLPTRILPASLQVTDEYDVPELVKSAVRGAHTVDGNIWLDTDYPYFFELLGENLSATNGADSRAEVEH